MPERNGSMETTIYFADVSPLANAQRYAHFYAAADERRRRRTDRYRFEADRMLSLGADGLLRYALKCAGLTHPPQFLTDANGKPSLADAPDIFFSISHAGTIAAVAVSDDAVGCDVEPVRPAEERLMRHVLTEAERNACLKACKATRDELFFRYWVCKESYLKATGEGLLRDPISVAVDLSAARICVDGAPAPYALAEPRIPNGYRCALVRHGSLSSVRAEFVTIEEIAGGMI